MNWQLNPLIQSQLDKCKTDAERERLQVKIFQAEKLEGMSPEVQNAWIDRYLRNRKTENAYHLSRVKHKQGVAPDIIQQEEKLKQMRLAPPDLPKIEYSDNQGSIRLRR
jgi:hypothetical protein